ncbi:NAD(P)/FAD-dependent oxidoreductase [Parvibaculaceae bacterium PLY_AMNH_Bact1]|nr:NAD(P)/FAD-dependent oxidoreductase [Parvibaculaceae bacterium PLY_AMNH_Bact1]
MSDTFDVIILGAGGAGLMCAGMASQRGRSVLVLDHAKKPGEKIRISGGGRCNFTNINTQVDRFLSADPYFARNALSAYTPDDFIALVEAYNIAYHEKTLGQLFCDGSSQQIIDMLLAECAKGSTEIRLQTEINAVAKTESGFAVETSGGTLTGGSLVVATGGKSIPKMGATGFGYQLAEQLGLPVVTTRPGLVPFTFDQTWKEVHADLPGVSVDADVSTGSISFREALLFTHRGLSGPSILQASSYWQESTSLEVNLLPDVDLFSELTTLRDVRPKTDVTVALSEFLPKRLAKCLTDDLEGHRRLADLSNKRLKSVADKVQGWLLTPSGTEGYRTAEVTVGGVSTEALQPKTLEARTVPGLYFIGEVVDVTGWLGGYNFQWAWASGAAAARNL